MDINNINNINNQTVLYTITGWRHKGDDLDPVQYYFRSIKFHSVQDVVELYKQADEIVKEKMFLVKEAICCISDVTVWYFNGMSMSKLNRKDSVNE